MNRRFAVLSMLATALIGVPSIGRAQAPIQTIEINQAIGVQKDNHLNFVAGKETVVRAFLAQPVAVDPKQTSATIRRDGVNVATLAPTAYAGTTNVVDFLCPTRAACGNWATGSYVFDVTVNGQRSTTAGTTYRFVARRTLRILAVPIKANYGGTIVSVAGEEWKSLGKFAEKVLPVAADGLVWKTRDELDASSQDLETEEGSFRVWYQLSKLMPQGCVPGKSTDGCFDKIIGFVQRRPRNGTLSYLPPAHIVVASDEDAGATVAHEIAHLFDVGDSFNGGAFNCKANPSPDAFIGKEWTDSTKTAQCKAGRVALDGVSATKVPSAHHPYDIGGRGALGDSADYMGSGGRQAQYWTSQDTYDWIFDKLAPLTIPQQRLGRRRAMHAAAAGVDERLIYFEGRIRSNAASANDVEVYPWWSFYDSETVPDTTGQFTIVAVDVAGRQLASQGLPVFFDIPGAKGQPPRHRDWAEFDDYMRFPPGTAKFQFLNGTKVLGELKVSAHAPVVSQISTGLGSVVNGRTSVTWAASDDDGDALFHLVQYYPDAYSDGWWLDFDLSTPQLIVDFSDLPGGDRAQICVGTTDRINSSYDCGPEFRVPFKPPYVYIWPLSDNGVFRYGDYAYLEAYVEDPQDGELDDESIEWRSNISGLLDIGSWIYVRTLPVGQHIITVTATNSAGLKTSRSVAVTIKP